MLNHISNVIDILISGMDYTFIHRNNKLMHDYIIDTA